MPKIVRDLMLPLSDYAVVEEDATIMDALRALRAALEKLPPGRQPHRAILIRGRNGEIIGKVHYFAFLRAFLPRAQWPSLRDVLDRAGIGDDLPDTSIRMLDLLAADLVDVCKRARHVSVRDVYTPTAVGIEDDAPILDAATKFLAHHTLSLMVTHRGETVGILRLSDLFDALSDQVLQGDCPGNGS